jgi:FtsH-binding integral membrane protein
MWAIMNNFNRSMALPQSMAQDRARFMSRVYTWMTGGLLLTSLVATYLGNSPEWMMEIQVNRNLLYVLMFAQVGAVLFLSLAINRISALTATITYLVYAALTGVTLSTIFMVYTHDSIASVFFSTACAFGGLSAFGYLTKRDLGPVGSFCGMALFGMIGWALLSFFFPSLMGGTGSLVYSIIGVGVFAGLTAYDTQKIKAMGMGMMEGSEEEKKGAIFGALMLYLDFINLFLMLLRLMGNRRD